MLTGDVPFAGTTTLGILHRHLYEPPLPVRQGRPDVGPRRSHGHLGLGD